MTATWALRHGGGTARRWVQRRVAHREQEMRVDRWLRQQFPQVPQAFWQKQIRQRKIRVQPPVATGGTGHGHDDERFVQSLAPVRAHSVLAEGTIVAIDAHLYDHSLRDRDTRNSAASDNNSDAQGTATSLHPMVQVLLQRVVYQDPNYLVLNKPKGLAVQDGSGLDQSLATFMPALASALSQSVPVSSPEADEEVDAEPLRLVHRLDRDTSGLLLLARHRLAAARFSALLRDGQVRKTYDALVSPSQQQQPQPSASDSRWPWPLPQLGEITTPIAGQHAVTRFRRLDFTDTRHLGRGGALATNALAALELRPLTGRKHQLRIHCAETLKTPIVGDVKYGGQMTMAAPVDKTDRVHRGHDPHQRQRQRRRERRQRLYLHARALQFADPFHAGTVIRVEARAPWMEDDSL